MRMAFLRRSIALLLGLFVLRPVNGEVCSPEDQMWNGVFFIPYHGEARLKRLQLAVGTVKSLQWEICYGTRLCAKLQVRRCNLITARLDIITGSVELCRAQWASSCPSSFEGTSCYCAKRRKL